jgi:hypothetical protein
MLAHQATVDVPSKKMLAHQVVVVVDVDDEGEDGREEAEQAEEVERVRLALAVARFEPATEVGGKLD